jgi:aldehyde dehydrogenase (NAD+)
VVTGDGPGAGAALVEHPTVRKIAFTGSVRAGREIGRIAADRIIPLTLELGGKSANIVFPDADLDLACAIAALAGSVMLSGQGCALPTRLYAHTDVYDDVVARVVTHVESAVVGDPLDPTVTMGPVVTEQACARILGVIDRARDEGAGTLLTGGSRLDGALARGYYIAPTVFGDVDQASDLARNEIFGPVLSILRFRDEDDVVALANDTPYGLAAYVYTRDTGAHTGWRAHSTSAASP